MAKIMHGKSLNDLDENKEYLVYYHGRYAESGQSQYRECEEFGKIKNPYPHNNWYATLYARGSNSATTISVQIITIDTSFIIEL